LWRDRRAPESNSSISSHSGWRRHDPQQLPSSTV
jgi:hypothetical protein